ncbi:MAG: hypothetical protein IPL51_17325 [Candidatus Competibacteraceae bacterium]|nr:hypothetical protein [Candidatus Competibacteraceae bacterium]
MAATPWIKRIRETKQLKVFNKAKSWATPVGTAIKSFNNLSLGVTLVSEKEEKSANVVLVLGESSAPEYKYHDAYYGEVNVKTKPDFKPDRLHGRAKPLMDADSNEIFFAVIFLPGKLKKATVGQKEVIVVHELIHACGFDEHDSTGIMFSTMMEQNGGLIEYFHEKDDKPMPPIRVGSQTRCKVKLLWSGEACQKE